MRIFPFAWPVVVMLAASSLALRAEDSESSPDAPPALANFSPGPQYADSARMYQGVPTIERAANGRLWAAWYGGGVTEDDANYVMVYTSRDDGASWDQVLVLDPDGAGPVRAFDPCLWMAPTGQLWLFWAQETSIAQNTQRVSQTFAIVAHDPGVAGTKWSTPREVAAGVMLNKPTVAADGRWLMPFATWFAEKSARVVVSMNQGTTLSDLAAAHVDKSARQPDEHMIVQRKDGSLWMLVRGRYPIDDKHFAGIGESVSTDGGKTWTDVKATQISPVISRFFLRKLKSGNFLLVRNDPPNAGTGRSHLTAFLSDDDGKTWQGGLLLDEREGVAYPDGIQAPDGTIDVIYDHMRTQDKEILMARFTEADVLAKKLTSPQSKLRLRVNQATGVNSSGS